MRIVGQPNLISRATGETHFFMVYGAEAVLPLEVTMDPLCVKTYDEATRTSSGMRISTWSTSKDGKLLLKMHATDRCSGATTSGSYEAGSSKWMIWSSGGCLARRA
jgi:hypothetical protein